MNIVAVVTGQLLEDNAFAFKSIVAVNLILVTGSTIGFLLRSFGQRINGHVHCVAVRTADLIGVVETACPRHAFEITHGLGMTGKASGGLLRLRIPLRTEPQQRWRACTTPCPGIVQTAWSMAGLAALGRVRCVGVVDVTVHSVRHDRHGVTGMAAQAFLCAFFGVVCCGRRGHGRG